MRATELTPGTNKFSMTLKDESLYTSITVPAAAGMSVRDLSWGSVAFSRHPPGPCAKTTPHHLIRQLQGYESELQGWLIQDISHGATRFSRHCTCHRTGPSWNQGVA